MMDAEKTFEDYKDYVYNFWDAHRNTSVTVNEDLFDPSTRKAPTPRANQVHGGERAKERRACTWCAKYKERRYLAKGHNTDRCFFGDNPGKVRLDAQAGANNAQVEQEDNIPDSDYFSAFYDAGATPTSFFKDKPRNFQPVTGVVRTAGADQGGVVTKGKGTASFGQLRLRGVVHVPTFKHNLVSGVQIMKMGLKQIIEHDKLIILDKGNIVASGHYDAATGLIKMEHDAPCAKTGSNSRRPYVGAATSDIDWHSRFGHIGEAIVTATLKRHGLEMGAKALTKCEPCCLGKAVRKNVPKVGSQPSNYNEIIESDTQGPLPIPAHDGTRSNVKFVEAKSGWVHIVE